MAQFITLVCVSSIKGILITAYSSLGSRDRPIGREGDPVLMEEPLVKEIAEKRKCTPAQVCTSAVYVQCMFTEGIVLALLGNVVKWTCVNC